MIDEDLEDEDLNLFAKTSRLNNDRNTIQGFRSSSSVSGYNDSRNLQYQNKTSYVSADDSRRSQNSQYDYKSRQTGDANFNRKKSMSPVSKRNSANKQKADEWHDPWDRLEYILTYLLFFIDIFFIKDRDNLIRTKNVQIATAHLVPHQDPNLVADQAQDLLIQVKAPIVIVQDPIRGIL